MQDANLVIDVTAMPIALDRELGFMAGSEMVVDHHQDMCTAHWGGDPCGKPWEQAGSADQQGKRSRGPMSARPCFSTRRSLAVITKSFWGSTALKDTIGRCSMWAQFSPHHDKVRDEVFPFGFDHGEN